MDAKQLMQGLLRNLLLAALVFLPVFLLANVAELKLRGVAFSEPVSYHASGAVVVYVGLLIPVLLGAIVHSAGLLLIPPGASKSARRIAAVALASLVPFTAILSGLAAYLSGLPGSAAVATLAYGLCCTTQLGRGSTTGDVAHAKKA